MLAAGRFLAAMRLSGFGDPCEEVVLVVICGFGPAPVVVLGPASPLVPFRSGVIKPGCDTFPIMLGPTMRRPWVDFSLSRCVGVESTLFCALNRLRSRASLRALSSMPFPVPVFVREPEAKVSRDKLPVRANVVGCLCFFRVGSMFRSRNCSWFWAFSVVILFSAALSASSFSRASSSASLFNRYIP